MAKPKGTVGSPRAPWVSAAPFSPPEPFLGHARYQAGKTYDPRWADPDDVSDLQSSIKKAKASPRVPKTGSQLGPSRGTKNGLAAPTPLTAGLGSPPRARASDSPPLTTPVAECGPFFIHRRPR